VPTTDCMDRFIGLLIQHRWPLFGLALLAAALAWYPSRLVRFDRSIENLFAKNDPLLAPYERLKRDFGGNEIILAVYQDDELLDPSGRGLARQREITRRIETVPGIEDCLSLARVSDLLEQLEKGRRLGGFLNLFRDRDEANVPPILKSDNPLAARFRDLFTGYTHSADGRTAAIVCMLRPHGAEKSLNVPREDTIAKLETIVRDLPGGLAPGVLAGEPVMIVQGFALLEKDGARLATWTLLLLGITILLFFHSLRWLLVPIAVVEWSLILTQALLVVTGFQLSMVSSMLAAIVTVVGVATVMHLIVHVREMRTQGVPHRAALHTAGVLLAGPIVGAILTDVAGFGSLMLASVEPVRDFGWMMVVGSLLVVPAICLLVPALALVWAKDQPHPKPGWGEGLIGRALLRSIDALHARPKTIAVIGLLIAAVPALGVLRLEVETDFTRNFRQGSQIVEAYEFVETHLGGTGVWDVIVPAPEVLTEEYLTRIRQLEENLRAITTKDATTGEPVQALTKIISLVDALDAVEADPLLAAVTPNPDVRFQLLLEKMPAFMGALRSNPEKASGRREPPSNSTTSIEVDSAKGSRLRIMLRARERQPAAAKQRLIAEVTRLANEAFPPEVADTLRVPSPANGTRSVPTTEVTGFFVLLTNLIQSILRDQWITFAAASAAIMAMVWIGFRSWKYAVIAMIPNAVPIYMVMGLLGWLGLKMNMGAAMIAAVSMGMSVDSSIHYYAAYRRARRAGKTVRAALEECQRSVGLAMIFSTIALIVGFGILITSDFVPTIYFGAMMSLAMLGGMLGNLIVLPLLLSWIETDEQSTSMVEAKH
jgi:uncharacterized protein